MSIELQCRECGREYKIRDEFAGKRINCKDCGSAIKVPAAEFDDDYDEYSNEYDDGYGYDDGFGGYDDDNPYAPPERREKRRRSRGRAETELASRGSRFVAALIDGFVNLAVAVPIAFALGLYDGLAQGRPISTENSILGGLIGIGAFVVLHGYLLCTRGQSLGKLVCRIRIVNLDGRQASGATIFLKRLLPIWIVQFIPFGAFLILIDPLFIFGEERRCVHDLIAGTMVVDVE